MKTLFNDLLIYEIVLLFLGVFLFLLLSAALIYYIVKKEEIKKLLFFFAIPLIMIGYPSIKEITISKDKLALVKYQEEYIENPEDSIVKQKLENITKKLESRAVTPEDIIQISRSKLLLGKSTEAIAFANKAIEKEKFPEDKKLINTDSIAPKRLMITNKAEQIKLLAEFQNDVTIHQDTGYLNDKLKAIDVNNDLKGAKAFVRDAAFERINTKLN